MKHDEVLAIMQEIFRDIFEDNSILINDDTDAEDIDEWDSFNHINLVAAIEQKFEIKFALGELQELENVGDMIKLMIASKL